jgi:hypothetical protein
MSPRTLLGFRFVGSLTEVLPEDRYCTLCMVQNGLYADTFGDLLLNRGGDFSLFIFATQTTFITLIAHDLGCTASEDPTERPIHRGHLVVARNSSGHLEDALSAAAKLLAEVKAEQFPQLDDHPKDRALLDRIRAEDRGAMRERSMGRFLDRSGSE